MARVTAFWLKYRGTRFPVRRGETVLGRSPYCSIVLSNGLASRQHCALRLGAGLSIVDLGSSNGTFVNGERLEAARALQHGDLIRVGTDLLEVVLAEEQTRARSLDGVPVISTVATGEVPAHDGERLESTETQTQSTLDLIESLVANAAETRLPAAMVPSIQRLVDSLLVDTRGSTDGMSVPDATRLAALIEKVASWSSDAGLAAWRRSMLKSLEGASK